MEGFTPANEVLRAEHVHIGVVQGRRRQLLVQDLSFTIHKGETVALVGESGSGKSLTACALAGLLPPTVRVMEGRIFFQGEDILAWPEKQRRRLRGNQIGVVFQEYAGSFTPFLTVGKQLVETICSHVPLSTADAKSIALEWLELAELPAERVFASYPFQLSGGQLQRVSLAAAMMLQPQLLIADEPTTALDVLTGERVLDLLAGMQCRTHCAVLLITHDLRQVAKRADTIAVMKDGQIVETGAAQKIWHQPGDPYTRELTRASQILAGNRGEEEIRHG